MHAQQYLRRTDGRVDETAIPRRLLGPISPARVQIYQPRTYSTALIRGKPDHHTPERAIFPGMVHLPSPGYQDQDAHDDDVFGAQKNKESGCNELTLFDHRSSPLRLQESYDDTADQTPSPSDCSIGYGRGRVILGLSPLANRSSPLRNGPSLYDYNGYNSSPSITRFRPSNGQVASSNVPLFRTQNGYGASSYTPCSSKYIGWNPSANATPLHPHNRYDLSPNIDSPHWHNYKLPPPLNMVFPSPSSNRVPITPSMLYAYALLRGHHKNYFDPLHHALYPAADRNISQERLYLPVVKRRASFEGIPKNEVFYWDALKSAQLQPPQELPASLNNGAYKPRRNTVGPEQSYGQYVEEHKPNLPTIGNNHYKGDKVFANFGYLSLDGKWVDPDSEGELFDAQVNGLSNQKLPHAPPKDASIMSPEEQDRFYAGFVAEVSDDEDGEGDPRQWQVSPETFIQWATGTTVGDRLVETAMDTPTKIGKPSNEATSKFAHLEKREIQFDMDTGSQLSGVYEPDNNPSLLHSPLGVDVINPPANFSNMLPQTMIDLNNQGFGPAWVDCRRQTGGFNQSGASTPEVFTSEKARQNLARSDDPEGYERVADQLYKVRAEAQEAWDENMAFIGEAQEAVEKLLELHKEVAFLKKYLGEVQLNTPSMSIPSDLHNNPRPDSPTSPTPKRRQYPRYLEEEIARGNVALNKNAAIHERVRIEYEEVLDKKLVLQREMAQLLKKAGVNSTADIPGLIPMVVCNPRANFDETFNEQ